METNGSAHGVADDDSGFPPALDSSDLDFGSPPDPAVQRLLCAFDVMPRAIRTMFHSRARVRSLGLRDFGNALREADAAAADGAADAVNRLGKRTLCLKKLLPDIRHLLDVYTQWRLTESTGSEEEYAMNFADNLETLTSSLRTSLSKTVGEPAAGATQNAEPERSASQSFAPCVEPAGCAGNAATARAGDVADPLVKVDRTGKSTDWNETLNGTIPLLAQQAIPLFHASRLAQEWPTCCDLIRSLVSKLEFHTQPDWNWRVDLDNARTRLRSSYEFAADTLAKNINAFKEPGVCQHHAKINDNWIFSAHAISLELARGFLSSMDDSDFLKYVGPSDDEQKWLGIWATGHFPRLHQALSKMNRLSYDAMEHNAAWIGILLNDEWKQLFAKMNRTPPPIPENRTIRLNARTGPGPDGPIDDMSGPRFFEHAINFEGAAKAVVIAPPEDDGSATATEREIPVSDRGKAVRPTLDQATEAGNQLADEKPPDSADTTDTKTGTIKKSAKKNRIMGTAHRRCARDFKKERSSHPQQDLKSFVFSWFSNENQSKAVDFPKSAGSLYKTLLDSRSEWDSTDT